MDFVITTNELEALYGLPHLQQLAYLRGIRPYMDVKTGIVGIKRGISYQSIAEQLYVEPHPGIQSGGCSREKTRRAVASLERAGIICIQSEGHQLILKCQLASRDFYVKNKADMKPTYHADIDQNVAHLGIPRRSGVKPQQADIDPSSQADTPLKDNNYLYLFLQNAFERFWSLYPEKKSKQVAMQTFQALNPDEALLERIFKALTDQIRHREAQAMQGQWVPPWKHPANWLSKRSWEDELRMDTTTLEKNNAIRRKDTGRKPARDLFWTPELAEEYEHDDHGNIIQFNRNT